MILGGEGAYYERGTPVALDSGAMVLGNPEPDTERVGEESDVGEEV